MSTSPAQDQICPICGAGNRCAMAADRPPEDCWCQTVTIDPDALAAIPEQFQGKVCICENCANSAGAALNKDTS